ncbi:LysR family transcriptional regulator [Shewanella colwelliana]|uniref:LysR family transcriptional regulator n=1 Tax=Shewanella colwelliana TaxID=23 RepID=A0ABQ4PAM6_SHECO|nr:LysR family transcriptional regulator [Shewanella colwelliana]GIU44590.1 LysR family transcriptional regulator [Shewanella colwelliana]
MNIRYMRYFVVLAELQHFSRTADKLNVTQPSLTRGIQRLEQLVGGKLFDRDSKNIAITKLGLLVLVHCQQILQQDDALQKDLDLFHGVNQLEIKIGASPIPSNSIVGPIMGQFLHAFPSMSVDLRVTHWEDLSQQLLQGELDLFVAETRSTDLAQNQLFTTIDMAPFRVIFCARPSHPLAQLPRLFLPSFRDYPLAVPRHLPCKVAEQFEDLFMLARDDFAGLVRFDQFHAIKGAMFDSDLIALTPEIAVREELKRGTLIRLVPQSMPEFEARFSVVSLAGCQVSQSINTFTRFLLQRVDMLSLETELV